jgi:hypothetical protein
MVGGGFKPPKMPLLPWFFLKAVEIYNIEIGTYLFLNLNFLL